jgi:hypothetical protein
MKKRALVFVFCFSIFPIYLFPQEPIMLTAIKKPGDVTITERNGVVLAEKLLGVYKVVFSGNAPGNLAPILSRKKTGTSKEGGNSFDALTTRYSGRIYSPNIEGPIIFENKTAQELMLLEFPIFPKILEQPFDLFLDLKIQTASNPINDKLSDDAGTYSAILTVTLVKL